MVICCLRIEQQYVPALLAVTLCACFDQVCYRLEQGSMRDRSLKCGLVHMGSAE